MKKKIIALTSVIVALLLIAGIGLATWAFMSNLGSDPAEGTNPGGVTPVDPNASLGSIAVTTGSDYTLVFDQNSITYQSGHIQKDSNGYVTGTKVNESDSEAQAFDANGKNHVLTWTIDDAQQGLSLTDVSFYLTVYIYNANGITDAVEVKNDTELSGKVETNTKTPAVLANYTAAMFKLKLGTSGEAGDYILYSTDNFQGKNTCTFTLNLNNLLKYKADAITDADMLASFNDAFTEANSKGAVKFKFEAIYKEA